MPTLVKGFAVGRGEHQHRPDGSFWARPRLFEVEAGPSEVAVAIGDSIVWLTPDAATVARNLLNDAIEAMS